MVAHRKTAPGGRKPPAVAVEDVKPKPYQKYPGLPPNAKRCTHINPKTGDRCKRWSMAGVNVCATPAHGGRLPNVKKKAAEARLVAKLTSTRHYGNATVAEDHVGGNPVTGYLWELRRTAGKIISIEEMIAEIRHTDLIWGDTKLEIKDAATTYGVDGRPQDGSYEMRVEEARINLWVRLGLEERKHYAALLKIGISAGLEEKRMRMQEAMVLQLNSAITNIISNLGADPGSAVVRAMVRDELLALESPTAVAESL